MKHDAVLILCAVLALAEQPLPAAEIKVPAFASYSDAERSSRPRREDDGRVTRWREGVELRWYGKLEKTGELAIAVEKAEESLSGKASGLEMKVAPQKEDASPPSLADAVAGESGWARLRFADGPRAEPVRVAIPKPGYYRITLRGKAAQNGEHLPDLAALVFDGPAAEGAHFSTVERRNAASVHLSYKVPEEARKETEWFYMEVTPKTEPLASYYMATGWHRGYFGMQVNSPTERRIIFSVWDSGGEAIDRAKVGQDDRVVLLGKGPDVYAGDFGNEGTGGHSHLKYPWKLGGTFRFLMRAQPDAAAQRTAYTGWFFDPEAKAWRLISSFRAPKDGRFLRGLYSFNEDFSGRNGDERRRCEFGNGWIKTAGGKWLPLLQASFSHDGHGKAERLDRAGGAAGGRFFLANGGFVEESTPGAATQYGDLMTLPRAEGQPPSEAEIASLPQPQ